MSRRLLLLLLLWTALPAGASHQWAGLDLCEARKDLVPPGLPPEALPEPDSEGARLLQRYCIQCHKLPGPGHRTAAQWPEVAERMFFLMDLSHRFNGLLGEVEPVPQAQRPILLAYLTAHALRPWDSAQTPPQPYLAGCAGCHDLPDPDQHAGQEWAAVLARMERNARIMGRPLPSPATMAAIRDFLGAPAGAELPAPAPEPSGNPWLALGSFLLLTGVGLVRWRRGAVAGNAGRASGRPS